MIRRMLLLLLCAGTLALWAADNPAVERLPNGMRLLVQPMTASGVVSAELLIDYSALDETPRTQGIRQVLLSAMLQGSAARSGDDIRDALDGMGGTLEGRVHLEMLEFTVTVPADRLKDGLDALAEIVLRPALTTETIEAARQRALRDQQRQATGAVEAAEIIAHRALYRGHPFVTEGLGLAETLRLLTPTDVRDAYRRFVTPGSGVLAIVGRDDAEAMRTAARERFAAWSGTTRRLRIDLGMPALADSEVLLRELPVHNTCVMLAFPVVGATHPDFLALRLLDTVLAGGTDARLFRELREEKRLAYETSTRFPVYAANARFAVYALTRVGEMEETKAALQGALAKLQTDLVSDAELKRAKAYLKGQYLLSHQYSAQYAYDLAWYELTGQGIQHLRELPAAIDALTPSDLQRVARTYLTHYYLVVVMPEMLPAN